MRIVILATLLCFSQAFAQSSSARIDYPTKPIRIIVPFPPGGINDFAARSVSGELAEQLKVPVTIDNRPGAGGIVGTQLAAAASPDGYTVIVGSVASHAIKQSLLKNPPYDVLRDFEPIVHIADTALIVVTHPSVPIKSIRDLISLANAEKSALNYASSGIGTATHLATELFGTMANVRLVHVAYKGAGPAITDLIGGHVPLMFATMPSALPHAKSGKLRALAVTSAKRSPMAPEIPTVAEGGVRGYAVTSWSGMFAPKGTPGVAVNTLAQRIDKILKTSASQKYFFSQGAEAIGGTSRDFTAFVASEIKKWKTVVEKSGAVAN